MQGEEGDVLCRMFCMEIRHTYAAVSRVLSQQRHQILDKIPASVTRDTRLKKI
jgi:hypothetical protein